MEHSRSEADKIPWLSQNLKVHCSVHDSQPLVPIFSQISPVSLRCIQYCPPICASIFRMVSSLHTFQPSFCIHFSTPHIAHCSLLHFTVQIMSREQHKLRKSSLCDFLHPPLSFHPSKKSPQNSVRVYWRISCTILFMAAEIFTVRELKLNVLGRRPERGKKHGDVSPIPDIRPCVNNTPRASVAITALRVYLFRSRSDWSPAKFQYYWGKKVQVPVF
jgi:hypothetical protein